MAFLEGDTGRIAWANAVQTILNALGTTYATKVHAHVKADAGLALVDNTSDADKPVSTAQAAADTAAKARANHTGTQLAATVSDFAASVDARLPVAAVAQVTTSIPGITTTDVILVTAPAVTGDGVKRFKITASLLAFSSVAGDVFTFKIKDNGTQVRFATGTMAAGSYINTNQMTISLVPAAGSHVYTLTAVRASGTGSGTGSGTIDNPLEIIVERIA